MNHDKSKIPASVLIIGQNSAKHLKRCLDSLNNFEEIIFIDGGSQDQTQAIAESYSNVKFIFNAWPGFIPQRNFSIDKATKDWCFMIDTDEALTFELENEIRRIVKLNDPAIPLYRVCRTEYFEGQAIESGINSSDYQERLFIRTRVRYTGGNHHEHLVDGINSNQASHLVRNLPFNLRVLHDPSYTFEDMALKIPRFSLLVGEEKFLKGRRVTLFGIMFTFIWTTIRFSFKSRREGRRGFIQAFMKAISDTQAKIYIYCLTHFRNEKNNDTNSKYLG